MAQKRGQLEEKMKNEIILTSTKDMTPEEWLNFRHRGIGASEVSTVLGLNRFKSSIVLFYEKLGEAVFSIETLPMFLGKEREQFLADMWEYWDGSQEGMIRNYRAGTVQRRCKKVNAYAQNKAYPWLFVSLDREINKTGLRGNGALELKEISGYEADKWEAGVPVGYVIQNQTQVGVCEYQFGELAVLRDNVEFNVLPFDASTTIFNNVVARTKIFWDKVQEGRKIMTQRFEAHRTYNMRLAEELDAQLQALEPEPDGSEAYTEFMKVKYRIAEPGLVTGGLAELEIAKEHQEVAGRIKELEEKKRLRENQLKNAMRDKGDKIDFGLNGYVSWRADSNGARRFLNKVK